MRFLHPMQPEQLGGVQLPVTALQCSPQRTHDLTRSHSPAAQMLPRLHCTVCRRATLRPCTAFGCMEELVICSFDANDRIRFPST